MIDTIFLAGGLSRTFYGIFAPVKGMVFVIAEKRFPCAGQRDGAHTLFNHVSRYIGLQGFAPKLAMGEIAALPRCFQIPGAPAK
jgi:hypothetical protein